MSASKLRLYWRLQLAAHFMQKQADRDLLDNDNITTAQFGVLSAIANREDVTQKDVAQALGLNPSAVTAMVKRLLKLGYIQREGSQSDGRAKILTLTEEGARIVKNTQPPFQKINEQIENILSGDEIENLGDYLERLIKAFR